MINSKDPNEADRLLCKPSEVWNKRLITYSLYYHSVMHNDRGGHVKVTYDNGDSLLGRVEDVSFHNLGAKIAVGNYSFVKSPN